MSRQAKIVLAVVLLIAAAGVVAFRVLGTKSARPGEAMAPDNGVMPTDSAQQGGRLKAK
jgi:hypothetical protein